MVKDLLRDGYVSIIREKYLPSGVTERFWYEHSDILWGALEFKTADPPVKHQKVRFFIPVSTAISTTMCQDRTTRYEFTSYEVF